MSAWDALVAALTLGHLAACGSGVALGTLVGALPGLGPLTALALLLPFTFGLTPTAAGIFLAGIYYGAQYGGAVTAIVARLPGEASSAITCIDGYAMTRDGRAAAALRISTLSSFIGGMGGTLLLAIAVAPMTSVATRLEPVDYVWLLGAGVMLSVLLSEGGAIRGLVGAAAGLWLGAVGTDPASGAARWTFGMPQLFDGIGVLPLAVGMFALTDATVTMHAPATSAVPRLGDHTLGPAERRRAAGAALRGTAVGAGLGLLPGGGPVLASFASYAVERLWLPPHLRLGSGAVEGIAGPEAANNAAAQTSFVPLLALGLPANPVMALMLSAMVVHGVHPGPTVMTEEPGFFWGLVASMLLGNVLLLAINLPLTSVWARVARIPTDILIPITVGTACAGLYAVSRNPFDVVLAAAFGAVGILARRFGVEPAPVLLGFVLSRPLEEYARRAWIFADGDFATLTIRPIVAVLLTTFVAVVAWRQRPRPRS